MALFRSLFWLLNKLLFVYAILVYGLVYSTWVTHWLAGFMMMSLQVVWGINILFVGYWLLAQPSRALLSVLILAVGYPLFSRTYRFNDTTPPMAMTENPKILRVLNYNVMSFDVLGYLDNINPQGALDMIRWAKNNDADIKCFQEFYNLDSRPNFNTTQQIKARGYRYMVALHPLAAQNEENFFGLAIFSKYPIVAQEEIAFAGLNGLLRADIKIGKDTIRVINTHLRSMALRINKVLKEKEYQAAKDETKSALKILKSGFEVRANHLEILEDWIKKSPYPLLVCGDFNEIPYGLSYGRVRKHLNNAFEDAGSGFGFTYNKAPRFIRIDNQFYDPRKFKAVELKTYRDIIFSDHCPVEGTYLIN